MWNEPREAWEQEGGIYKPGEAAQLPRDCVWVPDLWP